MKSNVCIIDEILLKVYKNKNNIIISINRKMPIRILTSNNRIIIKPSQMEVAPLHRTLVISHKRRLFKNTKGI